MTEQQLLETYRETVHPLNGYMAKRTGGNRELTEDAAERSLHLSQSRVEALKEELKRLQALEAKGMISPTEVKQLQYALDAAQAELQLAALEKDVLGKLKAKN